MPLGAAIVGAGFIGGVHARSARLAGAQIVTVGASSAERSKIAAEELGALRPLAKFADLLAADDVDVVHICTPNFLHVEQVRAVLEAGKDVVCEKPLATSAADAAALAALARDADRVGTVPFVYRFYATVRQARALVADGAIGPLRLLHGSYLQDWMSNEDDWSWRVDPRLAGPSRAVADIGSHWCDLVEFVSGHRITRLNARLHTAIEERTTSGDRAAFSSAADDAPRERRRVSSEDIGLLTFETDRGAVGSTVISQVSPGRKNRLWFELDGSEASIAFDQERPEELWLGARQGNRLSSRDGDHMAAEAARYSTLPPGHPLGYHDAFELFIRDTYARIDGRAVEGLPTFDDGARAATIVGAALASSETGQWVDVPATGL